jgi:hypothetical protein
VCVVARKRTSSRSAQWVGEESSRCEVEGENGKVQSVGRVDAYHVCRVCLLPSTLRLSPAKSPFTITNIDPKTHSQTRTRQVL